MITKTIEIVDTMDDSTRLAKIKIQVEDEDYDKILDTVNRSNCEQKVKIGAKVLKVACKIPQVRVFLPTHLIDEKLKRMIQETNLKFEQVSMKYGVKQIQMRDTSE